MNREVKYIFIILLFACALCFDSTYVLAGEDGKWVEAAVTSTPTTLGGVMKNTYLSMSTIPQLVSAFAYFAGLVVLVTAMFKFKDHVDNPQAPLSDAIKRMIAGGCFLSLPYLSEVLYQTLYAEEDGTGGVTRAFGSTGAVGDELDGMIYKFVSDIYGPLNYLMSAFAYCAAIIFLIIGISRLMSAAKDGPRGPTGIGTITTFLVAGVLFAAGDMANVFIGSLFGEGAASNVASYSLISTDVISDGEDAARVQSVIDAVMSFVALVGFIAFIRGWFVLKKVADGTGGSNETLSSSLTFLIGGTIAINLGQFINILQSTVGISGITFQ